MDNDFNVAIERSGPRIRASRGILICASLLWAGFAGRNLAAQAPSFTLNYEQFGSSRLSNPPAGQAFLQDVGIQISSLYAEVSLPQVFRGGRTVLSHTLSYRRLDLDYENWDVALAGNRIERAHEIEYTIGLQHQLSPRWTLLVLGTQGIASDFEGSLSEDDVNSQAALVFIRSMNERLALGFGAAVSNEFGYPVPVLAVRWNNGSDMRLEAILPVNFAFAYTPNPNVELGLALELEGNRYHGDPDIYGVANPLMRYSVVYVVPSVTLPLARGFSLQLAGGVSLLRRFEFFDGDVEQQDYSLRQQGFVRFGIRIGG